MDFLKMLKFTTVPVASATEDENANDVDEPPDDRVPDMTPIFRKENLYSKNIQPPVLARRESLLTRAIQVGAEPSPLSTDIPVVPRGLSTTSSHSFASTAELTSDVESPLRSASPSPPPPFKHIGLATKPHENGGVVIAPITQDDKMSIVPTGEAALEKTLGRKRCIMFACRDANPDKPKDIVPEVKKEEPQAEAAPRKCRISFACPSRPSTDSKPSLTSTDAHRRKSSPSPVTRKTTIEIAQPRRATEGNATTPAPERDATPKSPTSSKAPVFHEFAGSHDDVEEWVQKAVDNVKTKLTIDDCLKKENAIRKLGKEAEEEAEEEERQQDELENEFDDDDDAEDDFAPSDDDNTDGGNESDDEGGFADSDSESEVNSEYQFWAPTTTTAATSAENLTHISSRQFTRSRSSSTSSNQSWNPNAPLERYTPRSKRTKPIKMRPGTPELPDSTDFVCGTFDEDRPLEAAYISCREQKRRLRHVPIPQDIDPSFPTSDPGEEIDEEEGTAGSSDQQWIQRQFEDFDGSQSRRPSTVRLTPVHVQDPAIVRPQAVRPAAIARPTCRSPPPPKHHIAKSPAPKRLFDHPPKRLRSPPPNARLRSPPGSPTGFKGLPFGITINHLAQRPNADQTSSLPHTPNPFFRNWEKGRQPISRITSGTTTPGVEEVRSDLHVRGPVDIVIGLEKKRQKRKEKFWRQNCRKVAKERAMKRPAPGTGAERMKELGLECAERTRGYGLGQPAQLVLSL